MFPAMFQALNIVEWTVLALSRVNPLLQGLRYFFRRGLTRESALGVHIYGHIFLVPPYRKSPINFLLPTGGFAAFDAKHYYSHPYLPP